MKTIFEFLAGLSLLFVLVTVMIIVCILFAKYAWFLGELFGVV